MKTPTCFRQNSQTTLIDLILTIHPHSCCKTQNFSAGISDCHNMISVQLKASTPTIYNKPSSYRSFTHFDRDLFIGDLKKVPFHVVLVCEDIDDVYWAHERLLLEIVDEHIPVKVRKDKKKSALFMNYKMRKEIFRKRMFFNKWKKYKTPKYWDIYRRQRNLVTKMKKQAIKQYFHEKCAGGPKSCDFWPTIKPFLSNKGYKNSNCILLSENNKIINDQSEVSEIFNHYFVNVAADIGSASPIDTPSHPSIQKIKSSHVSGTSFDFKPVNEDFVSRQIETLQTKKATGNDGISAKIIKECKSVIAGPLTDIINRTITTAWKFPTSRYFENSFKIIRTCYANSTGCVFRNNFQSISVCF